MNRINKTIVIIMCAFFVSCGTFYWTYNGDTYIPRRPSFSMAKEKFVFNNLIDTTVIYANSKSVPNKIIYLKFYNNGRVIYKMIDNSEKITKRNWRLHRIGYYSLKGNNLTTEFFVIDSTFYNTHYSYNIIRGLVKGDAIVLYKGESDQTYIKQKIDFVPKPSTW